MLISHTKPVTSIKGGIKMQDKSANPSIKCKATQCKHHCQDENYCSLDCITIGAHDMSMGKDKCTDCESFDK